MIHFQCLSKFKAIKFTLWLMLICSALFVSAQDLKETVEYINTTLKTSHTLLGSVGSASYLCDSIQIDEHGKIEYRILTIDANSGKTLSSGPACYSYIKGLTVNIGKDMEMSAEGWSVYRLNLSCPNMGGCVICADGTMTSLSLGVNNSEARQRLKNAFAHLSELAKNNSSFYTKDPFAN